MIKLGIGLDSTEGLAAVKGEDRYRHLLCLGSTGTGKTTFLANLILKEIDNACVILDPNGHLTSMIKNHIPHERLIFIDKQNHISLNPLNRHYLNYTENAKELIQLINSAVTDVNPRQVNLTVLMTRITKNAIRVMKKEHLTIEYLMSLLDNQFERKKYSSDHFWKSFDEKGNREQVDSAKRVSSRLSLYYDDIDIRPFLTGENQFNLTRIVKEKKVVLINLEGFDDEATSFLGCLITNQIKSYYLHQAIIDGYPLHFYCDEFHLFITEHFERFLAEGRKFKLSFNFSGHSFAQLNKFFKNMLLRCHVKIALQNEDEDAEALSKSLQVKTTELINLKPFNGIARIGTHNHRIKLFSPPKSIIVTPLKHTQEEIAFSKDKFNFLGDEWVSF